MMKTILTAALVLSMLPASFAQEHYARWEWQDFGQHLPPEWDVDQGIFADFNGLVAGSHRPFGGPQQSTLYDVQAGTLTALPNPDPLVFDLSGDFALVSESLYDNASGELRQLPPPDGLNFVAVAAVSPQGRVVAAAERSDEFGQGLGWGSIVVYDGAAFTKEIDPPDSREVLPGTGIFVPSGYLSPFAISPNGRYAAGQHMDAETGTVAGFVADLETGEVTVGGPLYYAVNNSGQATELRSINAAGQAVDLPAMDDAGRLLRFGAGPLVPWPPDPAVMVETLQLQIGLPIAIAGDYNASGGVEQGDLDLVLSGWGSAERPAGWVHDLDAFSGVIDQAELDRVLSRWGASDGTVVVGLPEMLGAVAVPEPPTWGIVAAILLMALPLRRIVRRQWPGGRR